MEGYSILPENTIQPKLCQKCVLPETFPGIKFDAAGVCSYCQKDEKTIEKAPVRKAQYRQRLDQLVKETQAEARTYDAIMAYSGGKDSSYTLKLLRDRYDLRIAALTFDNHFVSPAAYDNIKKVCDALHVDHIIFKPPWSVIKPLFALTAQTDPFAAPTLLRASSICTACIGLVKSLVLKTALEMSIPLVAFGWSPGQAPIQSGIMKTNPRLIRMNQSALKKALPVEIAASITPYLLPDQYYEKYDHKFPHNIHPLAFFDYDETAIKEELGTIGWQAPSDTDTNSSNCLLNAYANQCHIKRCGFHPYVWEIANLVRQGVMERDEGIEKIYTEQNAEMVHYAQMRLK